MVMQASQSKEQDIVIKSKKLKNVEEYKYLECKLTQNANLYTEHNKFELAINSSTLSNSKKRFGEYETYNVQKNRRRHFNI